VIVAVLDSNVILSGLLGIRKPNSVLGEIMRRARDGEFELCLSEAILVELDHVIESKRYLDARLGRSWREGVRADLVSLAILVDAPDVIPGVAPHRHDDPILATVAASHADWFVTGDRELLAMREYAGVPFTDPNGFLAALDAAP